MQEPWCLHSFSCPAASRCSSCWRTCLAGQPPVAAQLPRERPVQDTRQAVIPVSQEYGSKREVLDWHTSLGQIATRTNDAIPASVIVEVVLGYKQADKAVSTEITQCQTEIKDYLRRYFTALTVEDLRPRNEEERRSEICNAINDHILSSSEIRDVRFLNLQVIEW